MVATGQRDRVRRDHTLPSRSKKGSRKRDRTPDGSEPGHGDGRWMGPEPPELRAPSLGQVWREAGSLSSEAVHRSGDERDRRPHEERRRQVAAEASRGRRPDDPGEPEQGAQGLREIATDRVPPTSVLCGLGRAEELRLLGEQALDRRPVDHDGGRLPDHERAQSVAPGGARTSAEEGHGPNQAEHRKQGDGGEKEPAQFAEQQLAADGHVGSTHEEEQEGKFGWNSPVIVGLLITACLAAAIFLAAQAKGRHPMVPLTMFKSRQLSVALAIAFTSMAAFFGVVFVQSLYFQDQRGQTPLMTGLLFLPMTALVTVLSSFAASLVARFGRRALISSGLACSASD